MLEKKPSSPAPPYRAGAGSINRSGRAAAAASGSSDEVGKEEKNP